MRKILSALGLCLSLTSSLLYAASGPLNLVLTKGVSSSIPIAIVPFSGQEDATAPNNVSSVIQADLQNSGQFSTMDPQNMTQLPHDPKDVDLSYWQQNKMNAVVTGNVIAQGNDSYKVNFALLDVFHGQENSTNQVLTSQTFTVNGKQLRTLAHHISDIVYQQLTGVHGIFSTKIAYVLVQRDGPQAQYSLQVADIDGYNPKPLLVSDQPIMSPSWSHKGDRIAYVTFEKVTPKIVVQDIATGSRRVVSSFPGINGAPAWSPDDQQLAVVLSKSGSPKIYSLNLASSSLKQLTQGTSIDTEPNWARDGKSIIFTSDRGGGPQIYRLSIADGQTQRLTFNGPYNARGSFTPDGKSIVMIHRDPGSMYNIAVQDVESGTIQVVSRSGYDASPSIAPNGRMVLYESGAKERGVLGMASLDGKVQLQVPASRGSVQDPSWSPYLS